uniref:Uncharacterized protein n=1 Tax=Romanomermis culicivorax TaxID=13658 RepID=A0A915HHW4_ROMCU
MKASLFTYDNSMTTNPESHVPFWPTTLDYALPWLCQNWQCPKRAFPGLWEIPINQFLKYRTDAISKDQFSAKSSMISSLLNVNDTFDDLLNIFETNFKRAYSTNKAPYILTLNAEYFAFQGSSGDDENLPYEVLSQFLREILIKPDVWIVTMQQLIEWMKNPTAVDSLLNFRPFSCSGPNQNDNISCGLVNKCFYTLENSTTKVERSFTTCSSCPNKYPWLNF